MKHKRPEHLYCRDAEHDWRPLEGMMARYFCSKCPATGERQLDGTMHIDGRRAPSLAFGRKRT